jgi:hypothetical protein
LPSLTLLSFSAATEVIAIRRFVISPPATFVRITVIVILKILTILASYYFCEIRVAKKVQSNIMSIRV